MKKKAIIVSGYLNPLHKGHLEYFNNAKALGERHRLIGLEDYGIVAEIWQHTDSVHSDEEDIVRVQDDFKRN